jgi:hypothetical protein
MGTQHLETSFTLVQPKALTNTAKTAIDVDTFADAAAHLVIEDEELRSSVRSIAMAELPLVKLRVGSGEGAEQVEFFKFDLKKDKKALQLLRTAISARWIDLLWHFEKARFGAGGDVLTSVLFEQAASIEYFMSIRRFLSECTDPEIMKRDKRSILLFHDSEENAPH